jgi:hypothetical protein
MTDDIARFMLEKVLKLITIFIFLSSFPSVAKQPKWGLRRLIVEVSRSHTVGNKQSAGLPCTSDQPVAQTATYQEHNKHNRSTCISSAGLEPTIPPTAPLQNYALNRTTTKICPYI